MGADGNVTAGPVKFLSGIYTGSSSFIFVLFAFTPLFLQLPLWYARISIQVKIKQKQWRIVIYSGKNVTNVNIHYFFAIEPLFPTFVRSL